MALRLLCPACAGKSDDCEFCGGQRHLFISGCPTAQVPQDVHDFFFLYDFIEKGTWPVAGGLLNQTVALLEAVRFARAEDATWKRQIDKAEEKHG